MSSDLTSPAGLFATNRHSAAIAPEAGERENPSCILPLRTGEAALLFEGSSGRTRRSAPTKNTAVPCFYTCLFIMKESSFFSVHPASSTLIPSTLYPQPSTLNPLPSALYPLPSTLNPACLP
ncbi:MAG: hypothetical protein JXA46_04530 [Dehalococcoidales bacterium]|nr:hypothetical protein [Dehalococcoidales bacterium]